MFKSGETTLFSRGVTALCIEGDAVFISMWVKDGSLFKWDLRTGTSETVASGHEAPITALCTLPGRVFSGGVKGHLREWLTTEQRHGKVMQGHQQEITSLAAHAGRLYSGCRDASIKQWSVDSGRCIKTFMGHLSVVRSIFAGEVGLLSGSADGTVRLWSVEGEGDASDCKGLQAAWADVPAKAEAWGLMRRTYEDQAGGMACPLAERPPLPPPNAAKSA